MSLSEHAGVGGDSLKEEEVSLSILAKDAMKRCHGDAVAAREYLVKKLQADSILLSRVVDEAIREGIYRATQAEVRSRRSDIFNGIKLEVTPEEEAKEAKELKKLTDKLIKPGETSVPKGGYAQFVAASVRSAYRSIMDAPMRNGKLTRYGTKEDFRIMRDTYREQSHDEYAKYLFYGKGYDMIMDGKMFCDMIDDAGANKLWRSVNKEASEKLK